MKVLFIGGNGNISWWCVQKAIEQGHDVYELNRGMTRETRRAVQPEVHEIIADIRDKDMAAKALSNMRFDVVCDFICFNEAQANQNIELFKDKTDQYIVISSEAVYKRESRYLPFREDSPQYEDDVESAYIAGKIGVERAFKKAYKKDGFPITIVRPGFTYDTILQVPVGQNCFTAPARFLKGYPFLIPGDGENLWAPLHSKDFAGAFVSLIETGNGIGEEVHIAGEQLITLNEMAEQILGALGIDSNNIVHIPYNEALEITDFYGKIITKQHMWHYIYDLSKIKTFVPEWHQKIMFKEGITNTVAWLCEKEVRCRINQRFDQILEILYKRYY